MIGPDPADYVRDPDYREASKLRADPEILNCIRLVRARRELAYLRHTLRNIPFERLLTIAAIVLAFAAGLVLGR